MQEFISHKKFTFEIAGQYAGEVAVPNSLCHEFVGSVLADSNRDVGYIFGGVVTWRSDPRNIHCAAVIDLDGNVHDVEKLKE